jgi:predicted RNase H-like HicB family nuclease
MKKPKIIMTVLKEDVGYSAFTRVSEYGIATQGDTYQELNEMVLEAVNLCFEDHGLTYTIDEIRFEYDLESFFKFYKVINVKALSDRIGMNQSLLSQYTNGIKKPSAKQVNRILQGVQQIGRELAEARFLIR